RLRIAGRYRLLRTRKGIIGLAVVIAAVGGGSAALLSSRSSAAKPIVLASNSLAAIDPRTDSVLGGVRRTFTPRRAGAGADRIWVLDSTGRTATAVDPQTLRTVRTVGVDVGRDRSAADTGAQWAGNGTEWVVGAGAVDQFTTDDSGGT